MKMIKGRKKLREAAPPLNIFRVTIDFFYHVSNTGRMQ